MIIEHVDDPVAVVPALDQVLFIGFASLGVDFLVLVQDCEERLETLLLSANPASSPSSPSPPSPVLEDIERGWVERVGREVEPRDRCLGQDGLALPAVLDLDPLVVGNHHRDLLGEIVLDLLRHLLEVADPVELVHDALLILPELADVLVQQRHLVVQVISYAL